MAGDINGTADEASTHKINKYNLNDSSSLFKVFIQKNANEDNTAISALKVAEVVHKITHGKHINEIKKVSRKRVIVICTTADSANELVDNQDLKNNGLVAYIPLFLTSRAAVIKDVDIEYTTELLKEAIDSKQFKIKSITRLSRRTLQDGQPEYIPTKSVKIIFEGQSLPAFIYVWKLRFQCFPFIRKVKQCYKCLRYGHIADHCNSKFSRCTNCGSTDHTSDNCSKDSKQCINCKLNHSALDKTCPERKRQNDINEVMAFQNISYQEASLEIPSKQQHENSYAVRTGNRFDLFNDMEEEFPELVKRSKEQLPLYRPPPISKHGKGETIKANYQHLPNSDIRNRQQHKRVRSETTSSSEIDYNNLTRLVSSNVKQRKTENQLTDNRRNQTANTRDLQVQCTTSESSISDLQADVRLSHPEKQQKWDEIINIDEEEEGNRNLRSKKNEEEKEQYVGDENEQSVGVKRRSERRSSLRIRKRST